MTNRKSQNQKSNFVPEFPRVNNKIPYLVLTRRNCDHKVSHLWHATVGLSRKTPNRKTSCIGDQTKPHFLFGRKNSKDFPSSRQVLFPGPFRSFSTNIGRWNSSTSCFGFEVKNFQLIGERRTATMAIFWHSRLKSWNNSTLTFAVREHPGDVKTLIHDSLPRVRKINGTVNSDCA